MKLYETRYSKGWGSCYGKYSLVCHPEYTLSSGVSPKVVYAIIKERLADPRHRGKIKAIINNRLGHQWQFADIVFIDDACSGALRIDISDKVVVGEMLSPSTLEDIVKKVDEYIKEEHLEPTLDFLLNMRAYRYLMEREE